jgi:2-keto-4-pentenoate hydratase
MERATFLAIEVEIGFCLLSDSSREADFVIGNAFVGIEVVKSRFTEGPAAPFLSFLADNIANGAYVMGREEREWQKLNLAQLRCRVWRDDEVVHDAIGGHPQGHPLIPLKAHWAAAPSHLEGFQAGQIVTTGTLCGVMWINSPCRIRADVEGFGTVSVTIGRGNDERAE